MLNLTLHTSLDFDAIANETVCSDLLHNEASEGAVERSVIKLMRISLGIQAVPKILLSLYLASWSDSFQTRKAVIVLANVGIFAGPLIKLALANIEDLGTADYLLLESFQVSKPHSLIDGSNAREKPAKKDLFTDIDLYLGVDWRTSSFIARKLCVHLRRIESPKKDNSPGFC